MGDPNLNGAQENLFGNYIVQKGLSNPDLQDEILAQVANQVIFLLLSVIAILLNVLCTICLQLFVSSFLLGVEKSEHFELRAWLAPPVFLSVCLPAVTKDGKVLTEVRNTVKNSYITLLL